jgi:hypothetical protein
MVKFSKLALSPSSSKISYKFYPNNIKHLKLIKGLLKILTNYVNKLYQQVDHDFRS